MPDVYGNPKRAWDSTPAEFSNTKKRLREADGPEARALVLGQAFNIIVEALEIAAARKSE